MLWTVYENKLYFEKSPHTTLDDNQIGWTKEFADHFDMLMKAGKMPDKLQFWTRTNGWSDT